MRKFFIFLLMSAMTVVVSAQPLRKVSGRVIDSLTQNPIADVQVTVEHQKVHALTDDEGRFLLETHVAGSLTLVFQHIGYQPWRRAWQEGVSFSSVIALIPRAVSLGAFVVEGRVSPVAMITEIPELAIRQSGNRDIGDFLREVPNMSAVRKGGSGLDPVVRGLRFSQLNVQLDYGIRIEGGCPNRMDPTTSHVEIEDIDRMEIIKGPYILKYGPAFGGIITLSTYRPNFYDKPELHATAITGFESNWNGNRQHIMLEGGNTTWSFNLGGGAKNYGSYQDGDQNTVLSGFRKYSYFAGLAFKPAEEQEIVFQCRKSMGRDVRYPALTMDEKSDDTQIFSLDYRIKNLSESLQSLEWKLYTAAVDHVMDNSFRPNYAVMQAVAKVKAVNSGGRFASKWAFKNNFLLLGSDVEYTTKDGTRNMVMQMVMPGMPPSTMTVNTNLWYNAHILNTGIFGEYRKVLGKYSVEMSARVDINTAGSEDTLKIIKEGISYFENANADAVNLSVSAGVTRTLCPNLSLSLAVGRGVRSPNMTERYIKFLTVGYDNYDYLGNPLLKPEANHQADLTLRYRDDRFGGFYINGFVSYITDYITGMRLPPSVATPKTNGAVGVKQFYNAESALLRGLEMSYQSPAIFSCLYVDALLALTQGSISDAVKYVYQSGQVVDEVSLQNDPLPEMPPLEGDIKIRGLFDKDRLSPFVSLRLVAPQKYVSSSFYEPETPGFAVLNAGLSYAPWKYLRISAGVNNILDNHYYEHLNRKIVGSTERLYEPGRVFHITFIASF